MLARSDALNHATGPPEAMAWCDVTPQPTAVSDMRTEGSSFPSKTLNIYGSPVSHLLLDRTETSNAAIPTKTQTHDC